MLLTSTRRIFTALFFAALALTVKAQTGLCPSNLDFEMGDLNGWQCGIGPAATPINNSLPPSVPIPGRHTIISQATAGLDPFGMFPQLCPDGGDFSVQLGNFSTGSQAESISYTYTIPATATTFSMLFHYAIILESPGHTEQNQPRFQARIIDMSTGTKIPCVDFDFIANTTPGGFRVSSVPGHTGTQVLYKDWTPISINLTPYIGKTIMLEFITRDCSQGGHAGYAYIDVSTVCNGAISGSTICEGENEITLNAPFGFASYKWYSDLSFGTLLATTQSLPLSPAPTVGSILPVIVEAFPGFGCDDTLYAVIDVAPKPISFAGPDQTICNYQQIQIGGPPGGPELAYTWTPASKVSNPTSSNPMAWNNQPTPTEFIVKTTNILTGCFSFDTTYLGNLPIDRTIDLIGESAFCNYGIPEATLSVSSASSGVQWYDSPTNPIPGATGFSFQPMVSGNYWAQIQQSGCTDTTAAIAITVHPKPTADFTLVQDTGCITSNTFDLQNTSSGALTYNWKFSDGTTQDVLNAVKTFDAVGTYTVQLVAKTAEGCLDSTGLVNMFVLPNGNPDFKWDSICLDIPVLFTNLSNTNSSPSVWYEWDFNNDGPVSTDPDPAPVTYSTTGQKDVRLSMTTLGCENDPVEIVKTIQVNEPGEGIRYRTITVPEGSTKLIKARTDFGNQFNWIPATQLTSYDKSTAEFIAIGNDVEYIIELTDEHTCVTRDTILMQILKKPGYYLPTAFTPNGDGLNDLARPYLVRMKTLKNFSIYNRWGNLIFQTRTEGEGWDGTYKGEKQSTGVYVWILEFYNTDGELVTERGTITLIR